VPDSAPPRRRGRQLRALDHHQRLYRRHGELGLGRLGVINGFGDNMSGTSEPPQLAKLADPLCATRNLSITGGAEIKKVPVEVREWISPAPTSPDQVVYTPSRSREDCQLRRGKASLIAR
jgi:hypothetical protein